MANTYSLDAEGIKTRAVEILRFLDKYKINSLEDLANNPIIMEVAPTKPSAIIRLSHDKATDPSCYSLGLHMGSENRPIEARLSDDGKYAVMAIATSIDLSNFGYTHVGTDFPGSFFHDALLVPLYRKSLNPSMEAVRSEFDRLSRLVE